MAAGFQAVYKRHTPFALAGYDYILQGGNRIVLDKTGDVLMYMYLYKDSIFVDWSMIDSIDMYIGGQVISSWDSKFITKFIPLLSSGTFSKTAYNDTFSFLPIPVPMIPTKNLRYHQCEFIINWRVQQDVRCMIVYAFVDESIPDCDILIHQMKKIQVRENEPTRIQGLVKYMVSDTLTQPTKLNDAIVAPIEVYKYYHTFLGDANYRNFSNAKLNLGNPRTCQRLNDTIYIFHAEEPIIYAFKTNDFFGRQQNYRIIRTNFPYVTASCTDGNEVYASTVDGKIFRVSDLTVEKTVNFQVWSLYTYNGTRYAVGNYCINDSRLEGKYISSFLFGDNIIAFGIDDKIARYNIPTNTVFYNLVDDASRFISDNSFDKYSASIVVNGVTYIASGYTNVFRAGTQEFNLDGQEQPYLSLVYDGDRYIYVYGFTNVFRYEIYKYSMFIPFCLETHSTDSSGYANFTMMNDVIFRGCGNGTLYTVNYNFLRIQNGMAGLLYAQ